MRVAGILVLGTLAGAGGVTAQAPRTIDLTGRPAAALAEEFTAINSFGEVAPGKVVIADMMEDRLVLGDFTANRVSAIGRKGNGPGEWSMPFGIVSGPRAGTVYVQDPLNQKTHIVDASGKIVESVAALGSSSTGPGGRAMTIGGTLRSDSRGRIYREGLPTMPGNGTIDSLPITRWDPASSRTDTVGWVPSNMQISMSGGPASSSGTSTTMRSVRGGGRPFAPGNVWEVFPDGRIAIVRGDPYRVDILSDGKVQRGTPIRYTPVRVTREERDAYREARRNATGMSIAIGGGSVTRQQVPAPTTEIPDSDFPDVKAPFAGSPEAVKMSPAGQIWVNRARAHNDLNPRYDIFDATGRVVAEARLRPHSAVVGFGADNAVYVSRTDPDTDIRYLEMYRLP